MGSFDNIGPRHGAASDVPLASAGFDRFEEDVLEIMRHFFMAFAWPEEHKWIDAFERAEITLRPPFGATLALAVMRTIRVLRACRTTPFNFCRPDCPICAKALTQEEKHLVSVLKSVRRNRRSAALTHAMIVCEGEAPQRLVQAFDMLCVLIGEGPLASDPPATQSDMPKTEA